MIEEDNFNQNQKDSTNIYTNEEEEAIFKNILTPPFEKKLSCGSIKQDDIYFIKSASKFSGNIQPENINNKMNSFGLMAYDFDNEYDNYFYLNNISSEELNENSINKNQEEEVPYFLGIGNDNQIPKVLNDNEEINIQIPLINKKEKEETPNSIETNEKPKEKKLTRGKRGPYKKKPKLITETKTDDECFPFIKGKGILANDFNNIQINQEMDMNDNTPFITSINIPDDSKGSKKRIKKARKYKADDIMKKIKVRFHKKLRNIINENLKKAGSNKLLSSLPQVFIGNITKKFNSKYMNKTFEDLLSDFPKEYSSKDCDYKQFIKNQETLKYLEENLEISKISGFNLLKKMKYRDILRHYFSSVEFEQSIKQLEKENEDDEYIKEYVLLSKGYIKYFSAVDAGM